MGRRVIVTCGTAALCIAMAAAAYSTEREHGAHVHGVGHLNVAVEGETVEMELVSPGADIVGFEHVAESAEDKAAVEDAVTWLKDGDGLFAFASGAGCRLEEAKVESAVLEEGDVDHEKHQDEGKKDAEHDQGDHAEFHAHYRFRCEYPDRLTHVDVRLFERFPAARELAVQVISSRGQSAQELTQTSARLKF